MVDGVASRLFVILSQVINKLWLLMFELYPKYESKYGTNLLFIISLLSKEYGRIHLFTVGLVRSPTPLPIVPILVGIFILSLNLDNTSPNSKLSASLLYLAHSVNAEYIAFYIVKPSYKCTRCAIRVYPNAPMRTYIYMHTHTHRHIQMQYWRWSMVWQSGITVVNLRHCCCRLPFVLVLEWTKATTIQRFHSTDFAVFSL